MLKIILSTTCSLLIIGCSSINGPKELVLIGSVDRDCKIVQTETKSKSYSMDSEILPDEAVKVIPDGCKEKFPFSIYVDKRYYYIYDMNESYSAFIKRNNSSIKEHSYIVDASTGELVSIPKLKR